MAGRGPIRKLTAVSLAVNTTDSEFFLRAFRVSFHYARNARL